MTDIEREVRDEGNWVWGTGGGEEACVRMRKGRVCLTPPGRDQVQSARLQTKSQLKTRKAMQVIDLASRCFTRRPCTIMAVGEGRWLRRDQPGQCLTPASQAPGPRDDDRLTSASGRPLARA
jgi:hypothetical protein